jgi:hypothetical protein
MRVSFKMEDQFLAGDYDSRVRNDVLLYIFNEDKMVYSRTIPYAAVSGGKYYDIRKTDEMLGGNLKLVAWAVRPDETETGTDTPLTVHHAYQHPEYAAGSDYQSHYMAHTPHTAAGFHAPHHHERYMGTLTVTQEEMTDEASRHDVIMTPAPGRIAVNIHDPHGRLAVLEADGGSVGQPYVVIEGGMTQMALGDPDLGRTGRVGSGSASRVRANLNAHDATSQTDDIVFASGMVGVLPSAANTPSLTAHVFVQQDGLDNEIATLTITADNTAQHFTALHSGDYIQFDFDLPETIFEPDPTGTQFYVTINGWVLRIVGNGNGQDL